MEDIISNIGTLPTVIFSLNYYVVQFYNSSYIHIIIQRNGREYRFFDSGIGIMLLFHLT